MHVRDPMSGEDLVGDHKAGIVQLIFLVVMAYMLSCHCSTCL